MRAFPVVLATALLVATASGQIFSAPPTQGMVMQPFQNPGEIFPGITISYLINAAGGIWQQERVIDSMAYACTDVLPYLGSIIPEVDLAGQYSGPICDQVTDAAADLDAFDAEGFCNGIIDMITGMVSQSSGPRARRQAGPSMEYPGSMEDPLDIIGILTNITRDLYGIDINMIINDPSTVNTICVNVKDNFLRPSLQDIISQFGAEFLSYLLPQAAPICQDWDGFLQGIGINSTSPYYPIIQDAALIESKAVGYDSMEDLCEAVSQTLSLQGDDGEARRSFSRDLISSVFEIPRNADRCLMLASGLVDDIIEPVVRIGSIDDTFEITEDAFYNYTGFRGLTPICNAVEIAFTSVVDLPNAVPFRFFPNSTITVEFFINAAGGLWLEDRTIDSLAFACSNIIPDLESMVPYFMDFSQYYDPVCTEVLTAASDLEAFDAEGSCNSLISLLTDSASNNDDRIRRQAEMPPEDYFDILEILSNITRDLYGIDIYDQSTICPNVQQFLEPSLPDITTRFAAELVSALLPQAVSYICQDWEQYLPSIGINRTSPYYQIIDDAADIASRMLGYESRDDICTAMEQALSSGGEERRAFGRNALESVLDIFTDVDRCSMIGNDAIHDIIEPILGINIPGFEVSSYLIQRYTGFEGVQEICTALETAFTELSGSTVMLTITGEARNGEELVYTNDLANHESSYFKELEVVFCNVVENHLTNELGSDLRRLTCSVVSFSPGSVVAELELEVFAITQGAADSLAQDVADLSTSENLILSSDGDSLTVSSFSATATSARGRGLSTGAIIGIVVGVVVAVVVLLAITIFIVCRKSR